MFPLPGWEHCGKEKLSLGSLSLNISCNPGGNWHPTVDGKNSGKPVDMVNIPFFIGLYRSKVVGNGISSINSSSRSTPIF